jgi:hypothetical protein
LAILSAGATCVGKSMALRDLGECSKKNHILPHHILLLIPLASPYFFDSNIKTHHQEEKINNGGLNFLDALSNNIYQNTSKKETITTTYVHPQQKLYLEK